MNVLLGYPNRIPEATLSNPYGTTWTNLTNVQTADFGQVARSATDSNADTKIVSTLTADRQLRALGVIGHNLSIDSTYRIRLMQEETASTNLLLQSQTLATTWSTSGSVTSNSTSAPDDTTTADTFTANGSGHVLTQTSQSFTAASTISVSVFAKANSVNWLKITLGNVDFWYNLSTGVVGSNTAGSGNTLYSNKTIAAITSSDSSDWYRCTATITTSSITTLSVSFSGVASDSASSVNTNSVYLWGAQCEVGTTSSSYIPTTVSSVTRSTTTTPTWVQPLYDTGATELETWPAIFDSLALNWEDINYWTGKPTQEYLDGLSIKNLIHIMPQAYYAKFILFEFFDTSNPDTYVEIAYLTAVPQWIPAIGRNPSYGLQEGFESYVTRETSRGGKDFFDRRPSRRIVNMGFRVLDNVDAYNVVYELERQADITEPILWVADADDVINLSRRAWVGRLTELSPLSNWEYGLWEKRFSLREII